MFQKLMTSKEQEDENQTTEDTSILESSGVEVLHKEENNISSLEKDITKEEDNTNQEGYTARKNN